MKRGVLNWVQVLLAGGLLSVSQQPAGAEVYRWQDAQGKMYYSSAPPSKPGPRVEIRQDQHWIPYVANPDHSAAPPPASPTVVSYRTDQAVMTIPVTLNHVLEQTFAVDTGSSYTIISRAAAAALGLHPDPDLAPVKLQTATGEIYASFVNIDSLTIGALTTPNVVAVIHDLPNSAAIAGLLGLNLLDRFTLTVDAARQQMTFTPIKEAATFLGQDCVQARTWMQQGARRHDGSDQEAWLYQQALAACPNLLEAYYRLGQVYYQQQAYAAAIGIHQRLLQLAPHETEASYRLGVLFMLTRQFEAAQQAFQYTLRLDPAHVQARDYLKQLQPAEE